MSLDGPSHSGATPDTHDLASTISEEMIRIHSDSYGQRVGRARSYIFEDLVVSVIDIELLPSEEVLVEAGRQDLVRETRHGFEQAISASFKAAVERATGRKVTAFLSDMHFDPPVEVELFMLDGGYS
jgi:uncharacterized protein YbcI